jgi:hypothetical protein
MEKDRVQRYAENLERTIQNNYHYLKETIDDFQEMCQMVTPGRNIPIGILNDIREMYKEMRTRLTEIRAVAQLLQGKYRRYYHRNTLRDKEIMEFGFIVKNCYSKFEYTVMQIEAMKKLREPFPRVEHQGKPFKWFCSNENQATFIKNLRTLMELDYESSPGEVSEERRLSGEKRNLTLFLLNGDSVSLDKLQSHIRLREHDIIERSGREEIRGLLAHLRKIEPSEVEKLFQRFMESMGFRKLKCLLMSIHSPKDLETDVSGLIKTSLQEMTEGEVKTLSI